MQSVKDRILEFIRAHPGLDDDEIAARLAISPRQTVNQNCRLLAEANLIHRDLGTRGKIVNSPVSQQVRPMRLASEGPIKAVGETVMQEATVVAALVRWLEHEGWTIERVAQLSERGADIRASRANQHRVIECKGSGSSHPMRNNYFTGVIGQILQRMDGRKAIYSIGLPDIPKFRRLWLELHPPLRARLRLTALFVSTEGEAVEEVP